MPAYFKVDFKKENQIMNISKDKSVHLNVHVIFFMENSLDSN